MCKCSGKCGCNITSTTKGEKGDASPVASLGYKVYTALLNQTGTDAPTETILQNTLGTVSYGYTSIGYYSITSASLFTLNKTFAIIGSGSSTVTLTNLRVLNANNLGLLVTNSGSPLDDELVNCAIEIRVYN